MKKLSYLTFYIVWNWYDKISSISSCCLESQANIMLSLTLMQMRSNNWQNGLRVYACDKEDKYESLREEFADRVNILYIAYPSTSAEKSIA